jgi:hypothetical protein
MAKRVVTDQSFHFPLDDYMVKRVVTQLTAVRIILQLKFEKELGLTADNDAHPRGHKFSLNWFDKILSNLYKIVLSV